MTDLRESGQRASAERKSGEQVISLGMLAIVYEPIDLTKRTTGDVVFRG